MTRLSARKAWEGEIMLKQVMLVAVGGGFGSVCRFLLSGWVLHRTPNWNFPAGTFLVNVIGCLVIGVLSGLAVKHEMLTTDARVFLFTGIVGGFTTFSAFGLETFHLLKRGEAVIAGTYVALSIVIGLLALWLGFLATGRGA
jgi:CrcB protein